MTDAASVAAPYPFDGGIVLRQQRPARGLPLTTAPLPLELHLPLQLRQTRLTPVVDSGTYVHKGQLIAHGTVPLHAPTSGTIEAQVEIAVHPAEGSIPALRLVADGLDRWGPFIRPPVRPRTAAALLACVAAAGITGHGGAGFPLLAKLERALAHDRVVLVVNAVESEPTVTSDEALLLHHTTDVLGAIDLLGTALPIERALIALDPANELTLGSLRRALAERPGGIDIELVTTAPRFPAGSERQLVQALSGRRLRASERPVAAGYLVQNAATLYALARAVLHGEPVIERVVSINGPALREPAHAWVRIGHPIADLLAARRVDDATIEVLHGGPVSGWVLGPGAVVTQGTYGLYARHCRAAVSDPCINCGRCDEVCPERLLPQVMLRTLGSGNGGHAAAGQLERCIECGACDVVCPSALPLLQTFRDGRIARVHAQAAAARARRAKARHEQHQARIAAQERREQERREARLKHGSAARWLKP
jgi:Na+-translocating ferredoxin:NAD+ oxidoreductase subunit C